MARSSHINIDGKSSTDQGDYFPAQSKGSHSIRVDLDNLFNWWGSPNTHLRLDPIPRDLNGDLFHWCAANHYSPRAAFRKDKTRKSGLDHYCRQCRLEQEEKAKATAKNPKP